MAMTSLSLHAYPAHSTAFLCALQNDPPKIEAFLAPPISAAVAPKHKYEKKDLKKVNAYSSSVLLYRAMVGRLIYMEIL